MLRKIIILMIAGFSVIASSSSASEPNDYIIPGRALLFNGTVSGLRAAYEVFDNGLNDPDCVECNSNGELIFLHAVTRIAMWAVRDNGAPTDSAVEFAREFDIELLGDYWQELDIYCPDFDYPTNQHNAPEIPKDTPDIIKGIMDFIDTSAIPEIDAVIDELNRIDNRFRIFLKPDETRMFFGPDMPGLGNDVEVDYGDVLILKGLLMALKGMLQSQSAYDVSIDTKVLVEKIYGNCFNINADLLLPHPDLLKVLPTVNDPNDGTAILKKARQDWIASINYYLDAIDYISKENTPPGSDPQEDELLYLDPNDKDITDAINNKLITLRDSISKDTVAAYPWKTKKIYILQALPSATVWMLILNYNNITDSPDEEAGNFVASDTASAPSPWRVTDISRDGNKLMLEMEYDVPGYWGGAFFDGIISEDNNNISNGTFQYWGPASGTIHNLSGSLVSTNVEEKRIDLNPIFGSSTRYPAPVNPRDLLPVFDEWNAAQPGTLGHGLGDDPTLGGILPDMTQYDWQKMLNLQPSGLLYLDFINPWQITVDGNIDDWFPDQLVFTDITGTKQGVSGVDIKKVYLAYDWQNLYGAIELNDEIAGTSDYYYMLFLSYSPDDTSALYSIAIVITVSGGSTYGDLYYMDTDSYGWPYWQYINGFIASSGQKAVEFKIPFSDIPDSLPGRFIAVESEGWDSSWYISDGEENRTHLKIGDIGTISGTVSYDSFKDDPIFVQAFTDLENPEESTVANMMITEPGPYTLEGIGLGWQGFVRAFTPLFGFDNPFELSAFDIQSSMPVFLMNDTLENVDITLHYPVELKKDVWESGNIDSVTREVDWYYFDAVAGGMYTLDLSRDTAPYAYIALYDRDADSELIETYYWQTQQINWPCSTSGRYYVRVEDGYYPPAGGTYQIRMTNLSCPQADIASPQGLGVRDCKVDFSDFAVLALHWLSDCTQPCWCDEADFDQSGLVDFADFAIIVSEWMQNGI